MRHSEPGEAGVDSLRRGEDLPSKPKQEKPYWPAGHWELPIDQWQGCESKARQSGIAPAERPCGEDQLPETFRSGSLAFEYDRISKLNEDDGQAETQEPAHDPGECGALPGNHKMPPGACQILSFRRPTSSASA